MIENFTNLTAVKSEMSMAEVNENNNGSEKEHKGVISLALLFERIISNFVTKGLVMKLWVLFESLSKSIPREWMAVTIK